MTKVIYRSIVVASGGGLVNLPMRCVRTIVLGVAVLLLAGMPASVASGRAARAGRVAVSPTAIPPGGTAVVTVSRAPSRRIVILQRHTASGWQAVGRARTSVLGRAQIVYRGTNQLGTVELRAVLAGAHPEVLGSMISLSVEKHGPGRASDHAFLLHSLDGKFHRLRWNPCKPIHYRLNLKEAPAGAYGEVREALRRIAQIAKVRFKYDGRTHYIPQDNINQKEPLDIAWANTKQSSLFKGERSANGVGGGYGDGRDYRIVRAYAVIATNGALQSQYGRGFGGGLTEGGLLLHELGHAMGLDHAQSPKEIMYYAMFESRGVAMYGGGDYRGLQLQGREAGCVKAKGIDSGLLPDAPALSAPRVPRAHGY